MIGAVGEHSKALSELCSFLVKLWAIRPIPHKFVTLKSQGDLRVEF